MKWMSFSQAALLSCAVATSPAWAVDTSRPDLLGNSYNPANNNTNNNLTIPNGGGFPGSGGFNPTPGFGGGDQFLSNDLFSTSPVLPGGPSGSFNNPYLPGGGTLPVNPVPSTLNPSNPGNPQDTGRARVTSPMNPNYNPAQPGTQNKWRLGVYSKDGETGVVIHDVVPGSAAANAGLEINDVIIAVNGYQVGYVNGQLFDCGTEFERLATNDGWVRLLVLNNRSNNNPQAPKLVNVPVKLDSRLSNLRGTVAWQPRQNLPANAILNIELQEVIGNNGHAMTFASQQIKNINNYPANFQIDYDPGHISNQGRYFVQASVVVDGREVYRTASSQRVLDQIGQPRPVTLQLNQVQQQQNPNTNPYPTGPQVMDQEAQVAQIVQWFQQYLGRNPKDQELAVWLDALRKGYTMAQVQRDLLAHQQFFNRCGGDKQAYITQLHQLLVNRAPRQDELDYWMAQYDARKGIRLDLAKDFQEALGIR